LAKERLRVPTPLEQLRRQAAAFYALDHPQFLLLCQKVHPLALTNSSLVLGDPTPLRMRLATRRAVAAPEEKEFVVDVDVLVMADLPDAGDEADAAVSHHQQSRRCIFVDRVRNEGWLIGE
jgi:hypothetical protein